MNELKRMIMLLVVSCIVLLIGSCSWFNKKDVRATPSSTYVPASRHGSTFIIINTSTSTSTSTPTSTMTPLPTLSTVEAKEYVRELFKTNRGCLLPCWWGFTPGRTLWWEAKRFLEQFAYLNPFVNQTKDKFYMDILVPVPEEIFAIPLQQIYKVQNGIIETMEIYPGYTPEYTLSTFLNIYGSPKEVWISTYSAEYPVDVLPFLLVLFYPERGILAVYGPQTASIVGNVVRGCAMDNPPSMFGLWSPDTKKTFMEAAGEFRMKPNEPGVLFLPLEEATKMDIQTFYETYRQPRSPICLETPKDLWPEQY